MSHHDQPVAANVLNREFEATAPNQRRKTLGWKTPAEAIRDHVGSAKQDRVATTP